MLATCGPAVMWSDLRDRRIPNRLTLAIALLAVPCWVLGADATLETAVRQVLVLLACSVPMLALYAMRVLGGGDVKLIGALLLWVPPAFVPDFFVAMLLAGGPVGLATLIVHRWRRSGDRVSVPYGVAIVVGACVALWPRFMSCAWPV